MAAQPRADYLILKRRAQEEDRRGYEQVCANNFKAGSNAEWEIRTSGFIEVQQAQKRYEAIRAADEVALNARRRKLADMLTAEQELFKRQLEELDESPAERKARMEARAGELKDKRENERLAYVRQQYERQWRMACDPLREQESKEILRATNAARAYQIGEKMKSLELDEQEQRAFDELWEKDRLTKLGREEAEEASRRQMDFEHKLVLDRQVAELHDFRSTEKDMATEEAELMRTQWELEREENKKVEGLRHEVLMKANEELHLFNKHKRSQLEAAVAAERKADADRLASQLALEAHENQREAEAREAMQTETRRFAEHMIAQKRALEQHEGIQEVARKAELDKAWDKRLAVWGKEQEARENLMAQVLNERKTQVEVKLQQVKVDKQNQAQARQRLEAELAMVNQMEAAKDAEQKDVRMSHRALLENQIKDKAFKRAAGEFNKAQERMAAERAEAAYQMMLNDQMAKTTSTMRKFAA
jgi:hypothetical protein